MAWEEVLVTLPTAAEQKINGKTGLSEGSVRRTLFKGRRRDARGCCMNTRKLIVVVRENGEERDD